MDAPLVFAFAAGLLAGMGLILGFLWLHVRACRPLRRTPCYTAPRPILPPPPRRIHHSDSAS